MNSTWTKILIVTVFIAMGIGIGLLSKPDWAPITFATGNNGAIGTLGEEPGAARNEAAASDSDAHGLSESFIAVSKEVLPYVVSIATTRIVQPAHGGEFFGPLLREFFGREFQFEPPEEQRLEGLGSGVIVSDEGYIVTNHHVIQNAEDISATLYDNRRFEAELVGTDALTEIAVIKIDAHDLPVAELGESEELEVGEWVLAFGNPLYLKSTVTAGIISAKGRAIGIIRDESSAETGGSYAIENFIQTDAAINPGNSGGPLVNLDAEVVGINTAIASRTGGYQGYGFAVPIDLAKKIMEDLTERGHVTRAWMGIGMRGVNERIAERYGLGRPRGVIVQQVTEDSPADKAGLRPLDIIVAVDGKEIERTNEVQNIIALKDPGDVVTVELLRDGEKIKKEIELGKRETGVERKREKEEDTSKLGLTVQNLTPAILSQLGHNHYDPSDGVVVTNVVRYGAAHDAGIRPGDFIIAIEDHDVDSVSDYKDAMEEFSEGDVVIFSMQREALTWYAFVKLPQE